MGIYLNPGIDLNGEYQMFMHRERVLLDLTRFVREEFKTEFPGIVFDKEDSIARCMLKVYAETQETFIILIDEYDVLVREKVPEVLFDEYMSYLNGLFKNDIPSSCDFPCLPRKSSNMST